MHVNLDKKSLQDLEPIVKAVLTKTQAPTKSQVVAVFDISSSMNFPDQNFYKSGLMHELATRVLALGLQLDDDGQIPVYTLGTGSDRLPNLTKENLPDYINSVVAPRVGSGTEYAPVINKIVKDAKEGDPMLVLLFTDGANSDRSEARQAIIEASKLPIFFQWYGIFRGKSVPEFPFLEKMDTLTGRVVDNCGFSPLGLNTAETVTSDETALYEDMLKEYKDFPKKAALAGAKWSNKPRKLFGLF
jgi:hypothetical protein